jgi:type IV secretion system protein TrbL
MKKKCPLIGVVFLLAVAPLFGGATDRLAKADYNEFDLPLINGITYFLSAVEKFSSIAVTLAKVLAVICIVWNAFRLWMGTETVRKACVDIITKFLIFIAAFSLYPAVIRGTVDMATTIGATAGQGHSIILNEFLELYTSCYLKVQSAQMMIDQFVKDGHFSSDVLSDQTLKQIADMGKTGGVNLEERMAQFEDPPVYQDDMNSPNPGDAFIAHGIKAEEAQRRAAELIKQYKEGGIDQAMTILNSMAEVFKIDKSEIRHVAGGGVEYVRKALYDPFIKDANGKYKYLISPGSMIKTAVVIAQVISTKESMFYEEQEKDNKKSGTFIQKTIDNTVQSIMHFVLVMLMSLGVIASTVFFVIQYVMCVFEYFIVSAIGVIFIPFCLWDGTKSFAAKLVTLFSAYFIKILVMMFCVFWAFSAYLHMGNIIISDPGGITFLNFSYFIFTCLLGFVVTQNAPQIAVTILNGSPQLSMGEFMHAAGTAAAAGMAAGKAVQTGGKAAQKAGTSVQAVGRGVGNAQLALAAHKSGTSSLGNTIKSGIVNSASKMLTGRDTEARNTGFSLNATGDNGKAITKAEAMRRAQGSPAGKSGYETPKKASADGMKEEAVAEKAAKNPPEVGGAGGDKTDDGKPLIIS